MKYAAYFKEKNKFLSQHKNEDFVFIDESTNILLSAPHSVAQTRLGKLKVAEIGSLAVTLYLHDLCKISTIVKTKNNFDDANFDEKSNYKTKIQKLIEKSKIDFIIDIHGLAKSRDCDINLGINYGQNIENKKSVFQDLYNQLIKEFSVSIDNPFCGGFKTISGSLKKQFPRIWTIQIEINCNLTNNPKNFKRCELLLDILEKWLNNLKGKKI